METKPNPSTTPLEASIVFDFSYKPALFLGADRNAMIMIIPLCIIPAFLSFSLVISIICIITWFVCLYLFRWFASIDPLLVPIYLSKYLKYDLVYVARELPLNDKCPKE